jgi:hypothetical protein
MAVLTRITDFIPSTLIESQEVDDEFNQLVNLLSGVSTNKDTLLKFSDGTNPVLRVDQLGAGLIQQWLNNGTSRASLSALGKLLLPAGIGASPSSDQISNFGTYFADPTGRKTIANTNETDFSVKNVSTNVFASNGDFFIWASKVFYAANGNNKRYRVYWDSSLLFDSAAAAFNGVIHWVFGYAMRESSSILRGMFVALSTANTMIVTSSDISSIDFTATHVIKSTGQNSVASDNDVSQTSVFLLKGSV